MIDYEHNFSDLSTFGPIRYKNMLEKDTSDVKFFIFEQIWNWNQK